MLNHTDAIINTTNVTDVVRHLPNDAKAMIVLAFSSAYTALDKEDDYRPNPLGRWVAEALEKMQEEDAQLKRWIEEYERGGGTLSKEEEPEYWVS